MLVVSAFLLILCCVTLTIAGVWPPRFTAASAQTPAPQTQTEPPSLDALKTRERELEALRTEQRRTLENEARLKREIESIGDDRRRFNQQLIETASRVTAVEDRIAQTQARLEPLETGEQGLRNSLEQRRSLIAEVLGALQRIGRHVPSALMIRPKCWQPTLASSCACANKLPPNGTASRAIYSCSRMNASAFRFTSTSVSGAWRKPNRLSPRSANAPPSWDARRKISIN
jgi:hypothetical protein